MSNTLKMLKRKKTSYVSGFIIAVMMVSVVSPVFVLAAPVATINITQVPANNTLQVGQGWGLKAVALDESGANFFPQLAFAWSTSNSNVMTVTPYPNDISTAYIKAVSAGTTIITVSGGGISATTTMTVLNKPACGASFSISPASANITVGGSQQITATVIDQYGDPMPSATFYWMNSSPGVASITSNGLVTGIMPGQAGFTPFANGCFGVIYGTNSSMITVSPIPGTFGITASVAANANGTISPLGYTSVISGADQTYMITPNAGYNVADVLVDGVSQGAVTTYTFTNVIAGHTISATFSLIPAVTYDVVASAGANGAVSPVGTSTVNAGSSLTYAITPNAGYSVANVLVDNVSIGAVTTYTFTNVLTSHTISATFTPTPVIVANLVAGWNLIGWTNVPITAEALGLANAGVDLVSKWDATTQLWVSHIINFPLNNFTINPGDGVFVHKI